MITKIRAFFQKVKAFFLKGWLIEAIFLTCLSITVTLTFTYVADSVYKVSIGSTTFKTGNLTMVNSNTSNPNATSTTPNSSTTENSQNPPANNAANSSTTNPPASSGTTQNPPASSPPSSSPPPATPPPATPPPAPSGCFITVNGYLYNMQSAVNVSVNNQTSGKKHTHKSSSFQCGTVSAPTNMTTIYLSKHAGLGCWQRIAPYIYTPPAPTDPTC